MARKEISQLKQEINNNIYTNTTKDIKGDGLNDILNNIVDSILPTTGDIKLSWASYTNNDDWLLLDGREVSRTTYVDLYNFANNNGYIGNLFGSGDGSTTFTLPNMTRQIPYGAGNSVNSGDSIGKQTKDISHFHNVNIDTNSVAANLQPAQANIGSAEANIGSASLEVADHPVTEISYSTGENTISIITDPSHIVEDGNPDTASGEHTHNTTGHTHDAEGHTHNTTGHTHNVSGDTDSNNQSVNVEQPGITVYFVIKT